MEERNSHIDELIAAFLSRGLDKEAREELEAWISASEDNRRYFMQQQEIWFSAVQEEERTRYDADRAFEAFRQRVAEHRSPKQPKETVGWKSVFKYAAAVLVVGLVSIFSYRKGESNLKEALTQVEVEAPLGAQTPSSFARWYAGGAECRFAAGLSAGFRSGQSGSGTER